MANSFTDLKKSRSQVLEKLTGELSKLNNKEEGKKSYEDDRFWKPMVDKAGNGMATIRFLPSPEGEDMPWIQIFSHSIQGPTGQWLIDNCLTSINQKCPVCEHNTVLWNSGIESNKEIVRKQKRKLQYITNIYVVKDPVNSDNDGKVFLFKFGKKIFDKLNDLMNPEFEDETPINPFDLWEGANFKLKIRRVEGYQNYDKSEFDKSSPLSKDDDHLERIWKSEYKLSEFLDKSNFKSYDQIKERLNVVLGITGLASMNKISSISETSTLPRASNNLTEDYVDEDLSYFEKLTEDD